MRTLVDIPEEDLKLLKTVTRKLGVSRAEFVRRAIAQSLQPHRHKTGKTAAFGLWAGHSADGLDYQEKLRSEW